MIDHTGHPHPSTPKARALCRANGGTGFIGKLGGDAPTVKKDSHGTKPHVPRGPVDTKPKTPTPPPPAPKTPTVPKDHGNPKPPRAPRKPKTPTPDKPKTPDQPTARPVPGGNQRQMTPKNFDPKTMQIKDGNGNWRDVSEFTKGPGGGSRSAGSRSGQYAFKDADGNLIQRASPNEKITVRDKPTANVPDVPNLPPRDLGRSMPLYIPVATKGMGLNPEQINIQNALRRGASRDFIVARSPMPPSTTNRQIDLILTKYGVPNHLYPRNDSGGPAPKIEDVKPKAAPAPKTVEPNLNSIEDPSVRAFATEYVQVVNNTDSRSERVTEKVLSVQAGHVGKKITRIKSVDNHLPAPDSVQGQRWQISAGTLAVCTHDGHIHLHENLHEKDQLVNNAMNSGWFTKGGYGVEQTMAHEMGHAFLNEPRMSSDQRRRIANILITEFGLTSPFGNPPTWYSGLLDRLVTHSSNKGRIKAGVSKYGATNATEMMAEVWAEYTMNPKPRPKIKKLGDVLKSIIAEGTS